MGHYFRSPGLPFYKVDKISRTFDGFLDDSRRADITQENRADKSVLAKYEPEIPPLCLLINHVAGGAFRFHHPYAEQVDAKNLQSVRPCDSPELSPVAECIQACDVALGLRRCPQPVDRTAVLRYVARCQCAGVRGRQVVVHEDASVHRQPCTLR